MFASRLSSRSKRRFAGAEVFEPVRNGNHRVEELDDEVSALRLFRLGFDSGRKGPGRLVLTPSSSRARYPGLAGRANCRSCASHTLSSPPSSYALALKAVGDATWGMKLALAGHYPASHNALSFALAFSNLLMFDQYS